jgi:small subunit ribosomal protein S6
LREHAADPRDYEMMLVVTPTVAEEGLPAVVERVSGYISTQGGTVDSAVHENPWGRRRLAYQINDHRDAFYVLYRFHAAAESIVEIEREIKLDEQIIRYLVVRYDEMTEHEERPPRGQAVADGASGGPFRRSHPAGSPAPSESDDEAAVPAADESPAASADPLPAQIAPAETAESPVPAEEAAAPQAEAETGADDTVAVEETDVEPEKA